MKARDDFEPSYDGTGFRLGLFATGHRTGDYMVECRQCGRGFIGDKLARECLPCAAKAAQTEIERLRAIVSYLDTFAPHCFPGDREMGFDVESVVRPVWTGQEPRTASPRPDTPDSGSGDTR